MKILHINTYDIQGGAARAVYRLHRALLAKNIDSQMFVQFKSSDDFTVLTFDSKLEKVNARLSPFFDTLPIKFYKNRDKVFFSTGLLTLSKVTEYIEKINPDIVHLHWVAGGMLSINDLLKINKPIVWSMHDNVVFTGGCHVKWDCEKYKYQCESCPRLKSHQKKDVTYYIFEKKKRIFSQKKSMKIIGLSNWIADCAKQSKLLSEFDIVRLPNLIDTQAYQPLDKNLARQMLNLSADKKLVLFGAMSATSDINKGFRQLFEALSHVGDVELLVFGSSEPKNSPKFNQKVHYLGQLHEDVSLKILYNAVDVMIVPSLQENLSNAIMESLACGTPVVAFDVGGNADLIDHKNNGYLAKAYDTKDLAYGINWVLHNNQYPQLCANARAKVLTNFDSHLIVQQYIKLYQEILSQ